MAQPNRLAADAPHSFGGAELDRSKPVSFRLDGRAIEGFAGDTVLTAVLANGIDTAGTRDGSPIALDEASAPLVAPRSNPKTVMPMDRVPALSGLDLVVVGAQRDKLGLLGRLFGKGNNAQGLGQRLDDLPPAPWLAATPEATLEADTLVIGGGVAGLSAAQTATGKTILVERRTWLGGDSRYFGTIGDEESPDAAIARLSHNLDAEILFRTEVFALSGTTARAHQVLVHGNTLITRVVAITSKRIVLATGAFERLPLFAGNRSPGVVGAATAFNRADRHGVWLGKRTLISTPGGHGYRLALLAKDAGVEVQRIADTRLAPNSRFIDFCKASGVSYAMGLVPRSATAKGGSGVSVDFAVAIDEIRQETGTTETDQFVVAGGWQPALTLWLMAGGRTTWAGDRLEAAGTLSDIVLAGSAAGYRGLTAAIASGRAAVSGKPTPIDDPVIEAIYESPDGPTPMAPPGDSLRTYLDRGTSFVLRPAHAEQFVPTLGLTLGEVVAAVQTGAVPPGLAGQVATERVLSGGEIVESGWTVSPPPSPTEPPAYLNGRFGPKPQLCVVTSADARYFERGCLIFASSSITDPTQAIGSIVGATPGGGVGGLALIEREASKGETRIFVRDAGGAVPVDRIEKVKA
jgi:sarcosine oxidase subunit alpha